MKKLIAIIVVLITFAVIIGFERFGRGLQLDLTPQVKLVYDTLGKEFAPLPDPADES